MMARMMEFWGAEIAPGQRQLTTPGEDTYCYVSQAALGPTKGRSSKGGKSERVVIRVKTGGKNLVLGTLVAGKVDQISFDLIFNQDFKLSHTGTSASVFFCGYMSKYNACKGSDEKGGEEDCTSDEESEESDEEESDEEPPTGSATAKVVSRKDGFRAGKNIPKITTKVKRSPQVVETSESSSSSDEEEKGDEDEAMGKDLDSSECDPDELDDKQLEPDEDEKLLKDSADDDSELFPKVIILSVDEKGRAIEHIPKKRAQISSAVQKSPAGGKKARGGHAC